VGKLKVLTAVLIALVVLGITLPIAFKVQYDRSVSRCTATPPDVEVWQGAQHGFELSPPGFWCEHSFPDGRVDRENYGLLP
jgi:hypothetical protein